MLPLKISRVVPGIIHMATILHVWTFKVSDKNMSQDKNRVIYHSFSFNKGFFPVWNEKGSLSGPGSI